VTAAMTGKMSLDYWDEKSWKKIKSNICLLRCQPQQLMMKQQHVKNGGAIRG